MNLKQFTIYYRFRDQLNDLRELYEQVEAPSLKAAKEHGKSIASERAPAYGGKYWFMEAFRTTEVAP